MAIIAKLSQREANVNREFEKANLLQEKADSQESRLKKIHMLCKRNKETNEDWIRVNIHVINLETQLPCFQPYQNDQKTEGRDQWWKKRNSACEQT